VLGLLEVARAHVDLQQVVAPASAPDALLAAHQAAGHQGEQGQVVDLTLTEGLRMPAGFYANLHDTEPRVILAHSRAQLLTDIGADLGGYAAEVLERNGVGVRLNTRVAEVTATRVIFEGGESVEANTVVTTIGSAPNPIVLDLCRQLGIEALKGRVPTAPTMRVPGHDDLWVAGDCAAVPWNDRGETKIAPPTAQLALRQGTILGRNLAWVLRGAEPSAFTCRYLGQLAAIGRREAVAEVMGFHFRGFFAWWLWRTIYLSKLPGTLRKLHVVIDWTFELLFPRDISLLLPPPDGPTKATDSPARMCRSRSNLRKTCATSSLTP
jgi:NADH dehydrogenase